MEIALDSRKLCVPLIDGAGPRLLEPCNAGPSALGDRERRVHSEQDPEPEQRPDGPEVARTRDRPHEHEEDLERHAQACVQRELARQAQRARDLRAVVHEHHPRVHCERQAECDQRPLGPEIAPACQRPEHDRQRIDEPVGERVQRKRLEAAATAHLRRRLRRVAVAQQSDDEAPRHRRERPDQRDRNGETGDTDGNAEERTPERVDLPVVPELRMTPAIPDRQRDQPE